MQAILGTGSMVNNVLIQLQKTNQIQAGLSDLQTNGDTSTETAYILKLRQSTEQQAFQPNLNIPKAGTQSLLNLSARADKDLVSRLLSLDMPDTSLPQVCMSVW